VHTLRVRMKSSQKLEGTLATKSLARLVVNALNRGLSGSLELRVEGQVTATVVFLRGFPVKARTAQSFFLVPVLAELGLLHESELPRLLPSLLASRELHGQALVRRGVLSPEEVEVGLREQLRRQLAWMEALAPTTAYCLLPDVDQLAAYGGDLVAPFDPLPFVWASIRAHTQPAYARARVAKHGLATFHLSEDADPTRFHFEEAALSVVSVLQRWSCRADEIAGHASVTEGFALLVLHTLLLARQAVVVPAPHAVDLPRVEERIDSQPEILSIESLPSLPLPLHPTPLPVRAARAPGAKPSSNSLRKRASVRMAAVKVPSVKPIPRTDDDEAPRDVDDVVQMRPGRPAAVRRRSGTSEAVTTTRRGKD
jgi:hypothetical protein